MPESTEIGVKLGLCLLAAAMVFLRHRVPGDLRRERREQAGLPLVFTAFLAVLAYYNFGTFHGGEPVHHHEQFHYYLSAEYFPELGYDGLYVASIAAQREREPGTPFPPYVQDLRKNQVVPAAELEEHLREVVGRFSPARWSRFVEDHQQFLAESRGQLSKLRLDHGFNGTPAWLFVARLFSRWLPPTHGGLRALAGLDDLLLAAMFLAIFLTYGARVACLSLIVFGLSYPSRFTWIGGGFLRQDWLAASVGAVCLLRRDRPAAAGALLGYAAMMRVFPALFLCGVLVAAIRDLRAGAGLRRARRLAGGFAAVVLLLLAGGCLAGRGVEGWTAFFRDVTLHQRTWFTNNVGLANVLIHDAGTLDRSHVDPSLPDPWRPWEEAMESSRERRMPLLAASRAALLLLTGAAALSAPLDAAVILGLAAIFSLTLLACYYWGMLVLVPLREPGWPATVALLLLNSAFYGVHLRYPLHEARYGAVSLGLAIFFTAWIAPAALRNLRLLRRSAPGPRAAGS